MGNLAYFGEKKFKWQIFTICLVARQALLSTGIGSVIKQCNIHDALWHSCTAMHLERDAILVSHSLIICFCNDDRIPSGDVNILHTE